MRWYHWLTIITALVVFGYIGIQFLGLLAMGISG